MIENGQVTSEVSADVTMAMSRGLTYDQATSLECACVEHGRPLASFDGFNRWLLEQMWKVAHEWLPEVHAEMDRTGEDVHTVLARMDRETDERRATGVEQR